MNPVPMPRRQWPAIRLPLRGRLPSRSHFFYDNTSAGIFSSFMTMKPLIALLDMAALHTTDAPEQRQALRGDGKIEAHSTVHNSARPLAREVSRGTTTGCGTAKQI
jgi:hypothetical protein